MVGRRPIPTALKVISGNPGHRPLNKSEPKPQAEFDIRPPIGLSTGAKKHWRELVKSLADTGMLTQMDRDALSAYCETYNNWLMAQEQLNKGMIFKAPQTGYPQVSPYVGIVEREFNKLRAMWAEFGLTPSSRSRLSVGKKDDDDEYSRLGR